MIKNFKFQILNFNFPMETGNCSSVLRLSESKEKLENSALQSGQAMITLLFFMVVSILITSAAIIIIAVNSTSASKVEQSDMTLSIAESGMENAILQLLRNPNYTGETLVVGEGSAVITATGGTTKIATSEGRMNGFSRKIEAKIGYTNNILTITSWKEIY